MSGEQAAAQAAMTQQYFRQLPRSFLYYGFTTVIDLALADRRIIDNFNQAPLHPQVVHCGEPLVFANGYPMSFAAPAVRFETFNNFIYDPAQAASIPSQYRRRSIRRRPASPASSRPAGFASRPISSTASAANTTCR